MARDEVVGSLLPEKIVVGLSTIVGITAWSGQTELKIKYFSGGTLEVGGSYALSGGATAAFTWGNGYVMATTEVLTYKCIGTVYLAAAGATVTAMVMRAQSPGVV